MRLKEQIAKPSTKRTKRLAISRIRTFMSHMAHSLHIGLGSIAGRPRDNAGSMPSGSGGRSRASRVDLAKDYVNLMA